MDNNQTAQIEGNNPEFSKKNYGNIFTKIPQVNFSKKRLIIFLATSLLISLVLFSQRNFIQKSLSKIGVLGFLRDIGLIKVSDKNFFDAQKNQNLVYDYNKDGIVTGEDYSILAKKVASTVTTTTTETTTTSSGGDEENGGVSFSLPSVKGFTNNEFDGSATVNYPIELPQGTAGLTPSLSLNYSSSSVDDLQLGTHMSWNATTYFAYQNQAGQVGLGWNLGGMGSITRDANKTESNENDDKFILSFEKGSADLVLEFGDANYSVWRTVPNLNAKVERYGKCLGPSAIPSLACRYSWVVTDGAGNKYYFGYHKLEPHSVWAQNMDPEKNSTPNNFYWYPLYGPGNMGYSTWYNFFKKQDDGSTAAYSIVNKWLLTKVKGKYDKGGASSEINYSYNFDNVEIRDYSTTTGKLYYPKASYPYKITWGNNEVEFQMEKRLDQFTRVRDEIPAQQTTAKYRVGKIVVKTLGTVRAAYKLNYTYGWKPQEHDIVIFGTQIFRTHVNDMDCDVEEYVQNKYETYTYQEPNPDGFFNPPNSGATHTTTLTSEAVPGSVVHSLLTEITQYSDDPDVNANAKKLPSNKFSYGAASNGWCGGTPLTSFSTMEGGQSRLSNYFYLQSAENGFGGKVVFDYWTNSAGLNALPTKYCDGDKLDPNNQNCRTDIEWNTGRHRVSAKTVFDGMGNFTKTSYNYLGNGATQGLAYVEKYYDKHCACADPNCDIKPEKDKCNCSATPICGGWNKLKGDDLTGFEFLGYPEVETITYQKNSTTNQASRFVTKYHQALDTSTCFKPSPFKGMPEQTLTYDVTNPSRYEESVSRYKVRFGPMFGPFTEVTDWNINGSCTSYDPKTTVTTVLNRMNYSRSFVAGAANFCTKTTYDYTKPDGTQDEYGMVRTQVDWGKVNCTDPNQDDTSDKAKYKITDYTAGRNDTLWKVPLQKESWISDSATGPKYNQARIFYDGLNFGLLGDYGNVTKTQTLIDNSVIAETSTVYDATYPWLAIRSIDPLGRSTQIQYESTFHQFPTSVTNAANQTTRTEYDFNTTDTTHPNYGGVIGVPVKTIDVNNKITTFVYDKFGRLITSYLPGKTTADYGSNFFKYVYLDETQVSDCRPDNNCMAGLGRQINNTYGPRLVTIKGGRFEDTPGYGKMNMNFTYYNGLGQIVQTRSTWYDGSFTNGGLQIEGEGLKDLVSSKSYNSLGAVEYESLPYTATPLVYGSSGGPSGYDTRDLLTDSSIKKTQSLFDGLGRAYKQVFPDGTSTQIFYDVDNNPLKTRSIGKNCTDDAFQTLCLQSLTTKDAFGNILEDQKTDQAGKIYKTQFEYDPILSQVTKTIDTNGNKVSEIVYDKLGRKIKMWDIDMSPSMTGDANSWRYEYDKVGNLLKQTSPKNDISEFTYDVLNRATLNKVNSKTLLVNEYDNCPNGLGRLCKSTSYDTTLNLPIQSKSMEYDARGRATKQTIRLTNLPDSVVNNKDFVYEYTYDEGGRVLTTKLPSNSSLGITDETLTNVYDRINMISLNTTETNHQYATDAKFNKNGQLLSYKTGDGVTDQYSYNSNNMRMSNLSVKNGNNSFMDLSYNYDPSGNITRISDNVLTNQSDPASLNQTFTYDALSRLTSAAGAYNANYTYDDIGNILTKTEGPTNVTLSYGGYQSGFYHRPQNVSLSGIDIDFDGVPDTDSSANTYDQTGNLTTDGRGTYTYDSNNKMVLAKMTTNEGQTSPTPTTRPQTATPTLTGTIGDANGDGKVDLLDYAIWLQNYNTQTSSGVIVGDFNIDNKVDGIDFALWRKNYSSTSTTVTPTRTTTVTPTRTVTVTTTPTPTRTPTPTSSGGTNSAPVITTGSIPGGTVGVAYSVTIRATDADTSDTLSMTGTNFPAGISFGNCSQTISPLNVKVIACNLRGTPTQGTPVPNTITINVSDGKTTTSKNFSLVIINN